MIKICGLPKMILPLKKKLKIFFKIKTGNCSFNEQFVTNNPSAVTMIISEFLHIHINNNQPTTKVSFFCSFAEFFFSTFVLAIWLDVFSAKPKTTFFFREFCEQQWVNEKNNKIKIESESEENKLRIKQFLIVHGNCKLKT